MTTTTKRKGVLAVIVGSLVVLAACATLVSVLVFGASDNSQRPDDAHQPTVTPTEAIAPEPAPTMSAEPQREEPEEEPEVKAREMGELEKWLQDRTTVTDETVTLQLEESGWRVDEKVVEEGAQEALRGTYASEQGDVELLVTLWADNAEADEYAAQLNDGLDEKGFVTSGDTYTNGRGTYSAYLTDFMAGTGSIIWTTDEGHTLHASGDTDVVNNFFASFVL